MLLSCSFSHFPAGIQDRSLLFSQALLSLLPVPGTCSLPAGHSGDRWLHSLGEWFLLSHHAPALQPLPRAPLLLLVSSLAFVCLAWGAQGRHQVTGEAESWMPVVSWSIALPPFDPHHTTLGLLGE